MIPRDYRFSRKNFENYRRRMKAFRVGDFLFLYRFANQPRFAAVCSKKVDKRAPKRNAVRRHCYQAFKENFIDSNTRLQSIVYYRGQTVPESHKAYANAVCNFKKFLTKKFPDKV